MIVCTKRHKTRPITGSVFLGLILLSLVWGSASPFCFAAIVDRIVAVVNNDIVTLTELNNKMAPFRAQIEQTGYSTERKREVLANLRKDMINQLIDQRLTDQEIKRYGIKVSEKEIDDAVERIKAQNYFTDDDLIAALANEGITLAEYREGIKEQLLRSKLVNYRIRSQIVVTEEDAKKYYNEHIEDYAGERKYHLRNIVMKVPSFADASEKEAVQAEMENVLEKLKEGKSFAAMAAIYSQAPQASKGGDLGLFRLADVSPQLQEALKDLVPGEFTSVLDTDQGYQIFYVEDIVQAEGKAFEDVRADIENKLYNDDVNQKLQAWLQELREKSHIKIFE